MGILSRFSRRLRRVALASVIGAAAIGAAIPAPADTVLVCVGGLSCSPEVGTPSGSTYEACGPGSPGALARTVLYGTAGPIVWVCDADAAQAVGLGPGYVVVGADVFGIDVVVGAY